MKNNEFKQYQKMTVFSRCKWFNDRNIETENDMEEYFKKAFIRSVVWTDKGNLRAEKVRDMTDLFIEYIKDAKKLEREEELLRL